MILKDDFFDRKACTVAMDLLGKVMRHNYNGHWLAAQIIETESYYMEDKASHSSLGYTEKRKALFMTPGTIYMYYARGMDSFNVSTQGEGNAVLIKSARFYTDDKCDQNALHIMQTLNPMPSGKLREQNKLCSGQALLCRSLHLKVIDWDQKSFDPLHLYIDDTGYQPAEIIQAKRLGIPQGRDEHLLQRYIDAGYIKQCSRKPAAQSIVKISTSPR